jgi:hypothetical protein
MRRTITQTRSLNDGCVCLVYPDEWHSVQVFRNKDGSVTVELFHAGDGRGNSITSRQDPPKPKGLDNGDTGQLPVDRSPEGT